MKARSGYKLDARVAKAAKLVTNFCPNFCPCCRSGKQNIEHWIVKCPRFNNIRSPVLDKISKIHDLFVHNSSTDPNINSGSDSNNSNALFDSNVVDYNDNNMINENVYTNSSVFNKVFNFLLGGRTQNIISREWKDLCDCQIKPGNSSDIPFLVVTAALLNNILPIAFGQQRSLFDRFKTNTTKSVNAEITVRQARASATNGDHNFVS